MEAGTQVKLKETSEYAKEVDRHNPTDVVGYIQEIRSESKYGLPVIVNWGKFTNSYNYKDLERFFN